jgi:hypothetical protein
MGSASQSYWRMRNRYDRQDEVFVRCLHVHVWFGVCILNQSMIRIKRVIDRLHTLETYLTVFLYAAPTLLGYLQQGHTQLFRSERHKHTVGIAIFILPIASSSIAEASRSGLHPCPISSGSKPRGYSGCHVWSNPDCLNVVSVSFLAATLRSTGP